MRTLLRRQYLRRSAHAGLNCGMDFANAICESVFASNMLLGGVMSLFMRKRKKNVQMCAFVQECMFTLVLIRLVQFFVLDVRFALVCDVAF